ncbi:hypothetical protein RPMA_18800 [Tardiphaga alba]|uniref:Uncharacterized protein n=1 Tax=Tardiphaga alba TaxID=340268 RepID=A0ABX8AA68_9BRAD|nr:hypothetical protein [Tardiphaga alba]QUS40651.1 hypothetical protein RPMA_18800 [Tardiphaga alba]
MAHTSRFVAGLAAVLLLSPGAVLAQSGGAGGGAAGGTAGTNSAGTANASGGRAPAGITTGASGTGQPSYDGKPSTGNDLVDKQDRDVDRKVKNICKGC